MKKFLLYCFAFFSLCSCATQKPITSQVNPAEIKNVLIIPPINSVKVLHAQNDEVIEDENYFDQVQNSCSDAIKKFFDNHKINYDELSANREEESFLSKEISEYYLKMDGPDRRNAMIGDVKFNHQANREAFTNIKVSDEVANLIKANNHRYALVAITLGFTRSKRNERNRQLANGGKALLSVGMAVLTGGFVFIRGIPYKSVTYLFLIDAEKKNMAMYTKESQEIDPTNSSSINWQINWGLEDYWVRHAAKANSLK
jgi:hypothetical protein